MSYLDLLKTKDGSEPGITRRAAGGWRAKLKPALKSSPVKVGVSVRRLLEAFEQRPGATPMTVNPDGTDEDISPLDMAIGPFWRRGTNNWYVQIGVDFDAPCRDCLDRGAASQCSHKSPETAALETAFEDATRLLKVLSRWDIEPSGFDGDKFVQRDVTLVLTGRRGLELRFERLMTPSTAAGVGDRLDDLADDLPTLDVGASRQIRRPLRAVLSQHPGDGTDRQGLRLPLDPGLAPGDPSGWSHLQEQLVELGQIARSADEQSDLVDKLPGVFRAVQLPHLEIPQKGPTHWQKFTDQFDGKAETQPNVSRCSRERLRQVEVACRGAGLEVGNVKPEGVVPFDCPYCGEDTGYLLTGSLRFLCHRPKCDAYKNDGGIAFPDWTYGAEELDNPDELRAALLVVGDDSVPEGRLEDQLNALPLRNVCEWITEPFDPWIGLRLLHRHPDLDEKSVRKIQIAVDHLPDRSPEDITPCMPLPRYLVWRSSWSERLMPALKDANRVHLEYYRGQVWCRPNNDVPYVLEPSILAGLKKVRKELLELDRLVVSRVRDIRRLLLAGWPPNAICDASVSTLEIPMRLLNNQQSGTGGDVHNSFRWHLAQRFADATESPLQIAELLDEELDRHGLRDTARREHEALIPILTTERPPVDFDVETARRKCRDLQQELESTEQRLQQFVGPLANPRNQENLRTRMAQEGAVVEDTQAESNAEIDVSTVPSEELAAARQLRPKVDTLKKLLRASNDDGDVEMRADPLGTCTGRISNRDPNLGGVNRDLRPLFSASDGHVLIGHDFSQIQIRILADYSTDEDLLDAFQSGQDIHRYVASKIFDKPMGAITSGERSKAKAVSVGVIMGMGAKALADYATDACNVETSVESAKQILDDYFSEFPDVRRYRKKLYRAAKKEGEVRSRTGRRCKLVDFADLHKGKVLSYLLQMTEADILKDALALLQQRLEGFDARIAIILHDEIILEADEAVQQETEDLLIESMTEAVESHLRHCPSGHAEVESGEKWSNL